MLSWVGVAQGVAIRAGTAAGAPGELVTVDVTLATEGAAVLATQNRIDFTRQAHIAARGDGNPDCAVNPAIDKNATGFRFLPLGCDPDADCTSVRVFVLAFDNLAPIADGARLYSCKVQIATDAAAATYPLTMMEAASSAAAGVVLPTTAVDGAVTVVPPPAARVVIGSAAGVPGDIVEFGVTLALLVPGARLGGVEAALSFDPATPVLATEAGDPDCRVDSGPIPTTSAFAFQPSGCTPGEDCAGLRAVVLLLDHVTPFADGATLFTCAAAIAADASAGSYGLVAGTAAASDLDGNPVAVLGVDGAITVAEAPPPPPPCAGDCDGSGQVSINELLIGVNILIGSAAPEQCTAVDTNGDGTVTVNELVQAVNAALGSCPV
jgi:hypothetical protein